MEIISFDSHKRYTLALVEDERGKVIDESRVPHERGNIRNYLRRFTPGSTVAVETIGNWYWIVDEIEEAGMEPKLVHARRAKLLMGSEQDRPAGRSRFELSAADGPSSHGLDTLRRSSRQARSAPGQDVSCKPAHTVKESHPRHV